MPIENDSQLKAVFSTLHRRRRALAPSFDAMRVRAVNTAIAVSRPAYRRRESRFVVTTGMLSLFLLATLVHMHSPRPVSSGPVSEFVPRQQVQELLGVIEKQIELNDALYFPEFPTDVLLAPSFAGSKL